MTYLYTDSSANRRSRRALRLGRIGWGPPGRWLRDDKSFVQLGRREFRAYP